jgi:hypothetical protein
MRRFRVHPPETRRLRHGPSHKEAFTEGLDQNKEHTNSHLYLNLSHPTVNSSLDGHLVSALFLLFYLIASSIDPHSFSLRSLPSPSRPVARFDLKRTNLFFDPKPFAPLDRFASGRKSSPPPCLYCTTPCALVHRPHTLFTTHTHHCATPTRYRWIGICVNAIKPPHRSLRWIILCTLLHTSTTPLIRLYIPIILARRPIVDRQQR